MKVQYAISIYWKKVVEDFLYRNYIRFEVVIEKQTKRFSGPDKAVFSFKSLTDHESGLLDGYFQGIRDATEFVS